MPPTVHIPRKLLSSVSGSFGLSNLGGEPTGESLAGNVEMINLD